MINVVKITIIIPVYNSELYLKECLDSVLAQSLKDIEVICINDGSTDGSRLILDQYKVLDDRITVFHKENEGAGIARNLGLKKAKGRYVLCVDSDDLIHVDTCKIMYRLASENNLDLFQVRSLKRFYNSADIDLVSGIDYESIKSECVQTGLEYCKTKYSASFACGKLWETNFIRDNKLEFSSFGVGEDQIIVFKSFCYSKRFMISDIDCYFYRLHESSITNSSKDDAYLRDHHAIAESMLEIIADKGLWNYFGFMKRLVLILFRLNKHCNKGGKMTSYYRKSITRKMKYCKKMRDRGTRFSSHIERCFIIPRRFWIFFKLH